MDHAMQDDRQVRLIRALSAPQSSTRLQAALAAGTEPDESFVDELVRRCAVEPDFFVRDMLTWALTRCPRDVAVTRVVGELTSSTPQARSQALHSLSKIGDRSVWAMITPDLLHDSDDEVARTAWRAAVVLVPHDQNNRLAGELVAELGRGDRDLQRSLSRALVSLGDSAIPLLASARSHGDESVRRHASATEHLIENPDSDFADAVDHARRVLSLTNAPTAGVDADR